ncbi:MULTISPECIES: dynamin family protein [Yersinia]|uniref:dynamin family protein n=1 Tax=Yersinia TaxID=629 RepID=UPI001CFE0C28|nr:dynamin family protein [Yersinia intermedia]ELX2276444.1 dynamin family protein [Yersinia enterocolitica]MCB5311494.1 dynamin family protein [Yersinia intermedia]MCB5325617.1 dynamin family protein [Yersinia intermedia]
MSSLKIRIKRKNKKQPPRNLLRTLPEVNVIVAATMSAGKTSLINALLGTDLLWSANEAATATITRIHHANRDEKIMRGVCFTWEGECYQIAEAVDNQLLHAWNASPRVKHIELSGCLQAFSKSRFLPVIYDTPGANNSQDSSHALLLKETLEECDDGVIVYVLNATQPATHDDARLLGEIKQHLNARPGKQIIFVLNKVDELDEEKGETTSRAVQAAARYLEQNGFSAPVIIPAMMQCALVARKMLSRLSATRSQTHHLRNELQRFRLNKHVLNNAALIPQPLRETLRQELTHSAVSTANNESFCQKELRQFAAYSGVRTLELYLTHYL